MEGAISKEASFAYPYFSYVHKRSSSEDGAEYNKPPPFYKGETEERGNGTFPKPSFPSFLSYSRESGRGKRLWPGFVFSPRSGRRRNSGLDIETDDDDGDRRNGEGNMYLGRRP